MIASQENSAARAAVKKPSSGTKIHLAHIDGLRGVACLMVFLMHCWNYAGEPESRIGILGHKVNFLRIFQFGNTGVHLFLVLSGFCLFYAFAGPQGLERFRVRSFAVKRARRILPAYYAALAFCLALPFVARMIHHWAGATIDAAPLPTAVSLVLHLFLLHGFYAPAFMDINGPFWSLSLEWQFYFTFPLLVWAFHKYGPARSVLAVGAVTILYRVIVWRYFLKPHDPFFDWCLCSVIIGRWVEFTFGMLAAWQLARATPPRNANAAFCLFLVAGAVAALAGIKTAPFTPLNDIFWGCGYFCLLKAALLKGLPLYRALSTRLVTGLGIISYSFYLIHLPLLRIVASLMHCERGQPGSMAAYVLVAGVVSVAAACLLYRFFERPFVGRIRETS